MVSRRAVLFPLALCLFIVSPLFASTRSWTGTASANWSDPLNWSPSAIPAPVDSLVFPAGTVRLSMTNDLPAGTTVGAMTFNDNYTLSGNGLTLNGDLAFLKDVNGLAGVQVTFNTDLKLATAVTFGSAPNNYDGAIDINGQTLTLDESATANDAARLNGPLNGSGTVTISSSGVYIAGTGTFSGTINGAMNVSGSLPNATVSGRLTGVGTVGNATVGMFSPGDESPWKTFGYDIASGVLHTKSLVLNGGARFDLAPGGTSDQVQVTGTVAVGGSLTVDISSGAPAAGQTFTIIDNDGSDPVNGTFTGMPERATIPLGGQVMRISYQGGDGNDIVLAVLAETSAVLAQDTSTTKVGEAWTLTDTVSSAFGTPTGSVSFSADGVSLGTASLVNGVASLTVALANAGPHDVVATFLGTGAFADSVSAIVSHVVTHGQTMTVVVADHSNTVYGQTVRFTVTVSVQAPAAGQPTGSVTILADGVPLGTAPLVNGTVTLDTAALHAGAKSITATYSGDANFDASTASAIQQSVGKAQTAVDARQRTPLFIGESPFVTVFVSVTPRSTLVPSGAVSVSELGAVLGTQVLVGGAASFSFNPFAVGDHSLVVNYGGDADFEASSETIVQSVVVPAISMHGARVLEGNRGVTSVSLVATLSAPVSQTVRVSFSTVAGSATAGEDYESASGVIEFAPGELTHAIEIHVIGDTFPESDETFSVLLSDPVNATIDTPSAMIVIANDDQVPPRRRASSH